MKGEDPLLDRMLSLEENLPGGLVQNLLDLTRGRYKDLCTFESKEIFRRQIKTLIEREVTS